MRSPAGLSLIAGLLVIAAWQLAAPLRSPPLYDGVIVQEPYRYLAPQSGQNGSPSSYAGTQPVQGSASPAFVAATTESPPQAQLIAPAGAFVTADGVTSVDISIQPVASPPTPPEGPIAGNTYRFAVSGPTGAAVAIGPVALPTVVLRAPDPTVDATIARYQGGAWQTIPTQASGQPGVFVATVDALGDFALIVRPASGLLGIDPAYLSIGSAAVLVIALSGLLWWTNRPKPAAEPVAPRRPTPRSKNRRRGRRGAR